LSRGWLESGYDDGCLLSYPATFGVEAEELHRIGVGISVLVTAIAILSELFSQGFNTLLSVIHCHWPFVLLESYADEALVVGVTSALPNSRISSSGQFS